MVPLDLALELGIGAGTVLTTAVANFVAVKVAMRDLTRRVAVLEENDEDLDERIRETELTLARGGRP